MNIQKSAVILMIASLLHLTFIASAFAEGVSAASSEISSEQSSQETSQHSLEGSSEASSEGSTQQGVQQSVVIALVFLGVAVLAGGIVLTVMLTRKNQREELINQAYRGGGQLLHLAAKQNGLSVEQTASIIRQANRKASKGKNRAAVMKRSLTTGILAARFRLSVNDVERINRRLGKSKKLTSCKRGCLLFSQLCKLAKAKRTLTSRKMIQQCSQSPSKLAKLCKKNSKKPRKKAPL